MYKIILHAILVYVSFQYGKCEFLRKPQLLNTNYIYSSEFVFNILGNRNGTNTQISDVTFYNNNNIITGMVIKLYVNQMFINMNFIYIIFPNPITMNQYSLTTSSGSPNNDPVSWTVGYFDSQNNGVLIDVQVNYPTPIGRLTQTPIININLPNAMNSTNSPTMSPSNIPSNIPTMNPTDRLILYIFLPIIGFIIALKFTAIVIVFICKKEPILN